MTATPLRSEKHPATDIDVFVPGFLDDPYPAYAELRRQGPAVWMNRYDAWVLPRHDEVVSVLSRPETFNSRSGVGLANLRSEGHWRKPSILLENDPPDHTRVRKALMRVLNPRTIRSLRERFEAEARQLVDRIIATGEFDAVADLAEAFPMRVVPEVVGVTEEGREHLIAYGRMVFDGMGPRNGTWHAAMANAEKVASVVNDQCRRGSLSPGSLGEQIYVETADSVNEEEAGLLVRSFLSAGIDTTVYALGSALYRFASAPDQWNLVHEDPSRIRHAFEEVLRIESPFQMYFRTAVSTAELGGVTIQPDEKLLLLIGSANRDPLAWESPDSFDVLRRPTGHLAFGHGIHGCVGQMIARLEAEVLLSELARRVRSLQITGDPVWHKSNTLRGLAALPLRVQAAH